MAINPFMHSDWRAREFPFTSERVYLNCAAQGIMPTSTRQAVEQVLGASQRPGMAENVASHAAALARTRIASMLHVAEHDLVFTANTTSGVNICAAGIDWRPGDNIVLPEDEFPSLSMIWQHLVARGVEVRRVPRPGAGLSVDELMAAVDHHTRVVSCSAIAWDTGYRMDLEQLGARCAAAGCLLVVDGIQAVGAIELDVPALRLAAISFHGYKWLLSDFGAGVLYVSPEALNQIQPTFVGEQSVETISPLQSPLPWKAGAQRYAVGGTNTFGLTALAASVGLLLELGLPQIEAHNHRLSEQFVAGLAEIAGLHMVSSPDPARRSAITVFTTGQVERDRQLLATLHAQGISVALRPRGIRVSPHVYNNSAEIEQVLEVLRESVTA